MGDDDQTLPMESDDPCDQPTIKRSVDDAAPVRFVDPEQIGPFKILSKLGEGGCGVVYEAQQDSPVKRRVALKVIKPGMDSKSVISRFEAERQALALMSHPNIAKVFDGGLTDRGLPYFVMELVKGEPITSFCDRNKVPLNDRLKLLIPVCQAVQHAHSKAVVHRDLKPSNILVGYNSEGHPHPTVIDFGVAKALNQQLTDHSVFTLQGQMIGTPEYMSPEQAEMSGVDIDTRTDVYSLGVVLYQLLTGMLPVEPKELRSRMYREMQRMIREFDPPRPSTRLGTALSTDETRDGAHSAARSRHMTDTELSKALRGELDWIVMKCLEKDRERRYATPTALAEELEHYLNNEPVKARPPSANYRLAKLVKRNKGVFAGAGFIAATLAVATVVSVRYSVIASEQRDRAESALSERDESLQQTREALALTEKRLEQIQSMIRVYADYEQQIRRIEGATTARSRLATATIEVLNELSATMEAETWIQHELANGYLTAGQIHAVENERYEQVTDAFTRARTLFADLRKQSPSNATYALGEAQAMIGLSLAQTGHAGKTSSMDLAIDAEKICESIDINDEIATQRIRILATSLLAQSSIALLDQKFDIAMESAGRLLSEADFAVLAQSSVVEEIDIAADAYRITAQIHEEQGGMDDAIEGYGSAIKLRERGVGTNPVDVVLRRGLIHDYYELARLLAYHKSDPAQAIELYKRSLAHAEHLRDADPEDGLAFELVLDQRKALASAMRRSGLIEESELETALLIEAAEDYVAQDPTNRLRQRRLVAVKFDQARVLFDQGNKARRDPERKQESVELLRRASESFAACSAFYKDLIDNNPLGSYNKFRIDAAEIEFQRAKAVETLGNATGDPAIQGLALQVYKHAIEYYNAHSIDSKLAEDQVRNLSIAHRNIGTIALSIPDGELAVEYLERADQILHLDRWDAYARKAEAYRLINDPGTCRSYAQKAFDSIDRLPEAGRSNKRSRVQAILDTLE